MLRMAWVIYLAASQEVVSGKRLPTSQDAWPFGIGPNNVRIEDMYITKLYHRSVGSFQPEIRWCTGIP